MDIKLHTSDVWTVLKPFVKTQLMGLPPDPDDILKILEIVVNLLDGKNEGEVLSRIDENVRRLIEMPMKSGQDHLRNALAAADESNRRIWLHEAVNEFTRAKNVELPPQNTRAMTYIALCFQCLGETALAARWYQDSYAQAVQQWHGFRQAVARLERPSVLKKAAFSVIALIAAETMIGMLPYTLFEARMISAHYLGLVRLFDLEKQILYLKECISSINSQPLPDLYFSRIITSIRRWDFKTLLCYDESHHVVRSIDLNFRNRHTFWGD